MLTDLSYLTKCDPEVTLLTFCTLCPCLGVDTYKKHCKGELAHKYFFLQNCIVRPFPQKHRRACRSKRKSDSSRILHMRCVVCQWIHFLDIFSTLGQ